MLKLSSFAFSRCQELLRSQRILEAVSVLEAMPDKELRPSKKVSRAVLDIVAVGIQHDMPTCTSNGKASRALKGLKKGLRFLQHLPRSLSECA